MQPWPTTLSHLTRADVPHLAQARLDALRRAGEDPVGTLRVATTQWAAVMMSGGPAQAQQAAGWAVALAAAKDNLGDALYPAPHGDSAANAAVSSALLAHVGTLALWLGDIHPSPQAADPGIRHQWSMAPGTLLSEHDALLTLRQQLDETLALLAVAGEVERQWRQLRGETDHAFDPRPSGALTPNSADRRLNRLIAEAPLDWLLTRWDALLETQPPWKPTHGLSQHLNWQTQAWPPALIRHWLRRLSVLEARADQAMALLSLNEARVTRPRWRAALREARAALMRRTQPRPERVLVQDGPATPDRADADVEWPD